MGCLGNLIPFECTKAAPKSRTPQYVAMLQIRTQGQHQRKLLEWMECM